MGLRVDRVLYQQFQQLCIMEKLRPGEAVETLMRVALEAKTIAGVKTEQAKQENTIHQFDDASFRSRLDRLKKSLVLEEQYLEENGELGEEPESEYWIKGLTELGRGSGFRPAQNHAPRNREFANWEEVRFGRSL